MRHAFLALGLVFSALAAVARVAGEEAPPAAETAAGAEPCVCTTGCRERVSDVPEVDPERGAWLARAAGVALGASLGAGLGREAGSEAKALRGFRAADAIVGGGALALYLGQRLTDSPPEDLARGRWSDCVLDGKDPRRRVCGLNGVDSAVRSALRSTTVAGRVRAARLSDATVFASIVLPLAVAQAAQPERRERDLLVAAETYGVTVLVNETVKRFFDRPRPFVHACDPVRSGDLCEADAQYSFYSGHTSTAFAMTVAAGTMSRYHGYRNESWVWGTGLTLATATGLLRIRADKHYATDVLVGAAVGSLTGWLVPRLHRPEAGVPLQARVPRPAAPAFLSLPLPGRGGKGGIVRAGFASGPFAEVTWRW